MQSGHWTKVTTQLPVHTFSFTSGAKYYMSSCCSFLATDFGAGWLLSGENCERCPGRRLQTERGVHPQDQRTLQAGPKMCRPMCLYERQWGVLLHRQAGINRCLWGFKTFLDYMINIDTWMVFGWQSWLLLVYGWYLLNNCHNPPKQHVFLWGLPVVEDERFWNGLFSSCLILRQSPCPTLPDPAHLLCLPSSPPLASISIMPPIL